ncbi:hypothetical protein OSCT_3203 [Oscillochloris trichoides DG-6]|uniref:Uncharacterized protein n=1 Tax=Oscillochloris trichoides DG-6 TaxID=765420 RepID=E1IIQ2_9CHLR|nr:hypothetical protein OSCT_3203 [Oscillochloris trichoides DG-6]
MFAYSGFPKGSDKVIIPLIQQANGTPMTGSGISIQNVGDVTAIVDVTFGANLINNGYVPTPQTYTIDAGKSQVILLLSSNTAQRYVGSARIQTRATNQQVVVVVNQASSANGSAYEGLDENTATPQVSLPLLMAKNSNVSSGFQCTNIGSVDTEITVTYSPNVINNGFNPTPFVTSSLIPSNGSVNVLQGSFSSRYVGSAKVTTNPPSNIVCVVNQLNPSTTAGDDFKTYVGVNY